MNMFMSDLLLRANNVSVKIDQTEILRDINLTLSRNEIVTVIGPNGAGKTTLVRTLLGLINPSSGAIHRLESLQIGYMPQKLSFDTTIPLTVGRFLSLVEKNKTVVSKALAEINITHLSDAPIQAISGGELQRVLLTRALLKTPDLLVLDEPVQGVDISGQTELYELIADIKDHYHCGILMISHDLHLVMAKTDKVVCLNQHICCQGHPENISNHPAYRELFGDHHTPSIAIYTHHHDHSHDLSGSVVNTTTHPTANND